MITPEQDAARNDSKLRTVNLWFRRCMHVGSFGLFVSTFFMKNCHSAIYPANFIAVTLIILLHQVFDIYLYCNDYMIDWENLPFISKNRLRYNPELFKKQAKALMIGNLVFGVISALTVASGYFIINRMHQEGTKQHLLCLHGTEWIYLTPVGNVFGTLHQLLILMQINITQYVLVRIPRNMGLFKNEDVMKHAMETALRSALLNTAVNEGVDEHAPKKTSNPNSLGAILAKIKQSRANNDDNFRA